MADEVTVDMDRACRVCGAAGAIEKTGACLKCTGAALAELKRNKVEDLDADGPGPKLKRIAALRVLEVRDVCWLDNMRQTAVPDVSGLDTPGVKALAGWCGRHPLDVGVYSSGGEVNVGLCVLKREPPASLVKATVEKELANWRRAAGRREGKAVRSETKARVASVLAEGAQWNLREARVVLPVDVNMGGMVYTDATGESALDAVCLNLAAAGLKVMPLSPEGMMLASGGLATADWSPPAWLGDKGTAGEEFLTWAAWRVIGAAEGDEPAWGINTPFVTVKSGSKEEVSAGGDASADELLRRSLAGGRRLLRMRLLAGPAELTLDAGLRVAGVKWRHDEPETAYAAAALAWRCLDMVFGRYAQERAERPDWDFTSQAVGRWIAGERS